MWSQSYQNENKLKADLYPNDLGLLLWLSQTVISEWHQTLASETQQEREYTSAWCAQLSWADSSVFDITSHERQTNGEMLSWQSHLYFNVVLIGCLWQHRGSITMGSTSLHGGHICPSPPPPPPPRTKCSTPRSWCSTTKTVSTSSKRSHQKSWVTVSYWLYLLLAGRLCPSDGACYQLLAISCWPKYQLLVWAPVRHAFNCLSCHQEAPPCQRSTLFPVLVWHAQSVLLSL